MTLFRSALLRLTVWYLLVIMFLSLFFSTVIYKVSTRELDRELQRTADIQQSEIFVPRGFDEFARIRGAQINESKERIIVYLLYFNLFILLCGGLVSFYFAKQTLQPIEEALESQHRFTADASHELRTPLTAMKTELEVALRDKKLTLEQSRALHQSNLEEIARLENLSNGLLQLAHTTDKPVVMTSLNLTAIITTAVEKVMPLAKSKHMTISTQTKDAHVTGDESRLIELVTILLDNAIKYSPEKTIVTVALKTKTRTKEALLMVADEGPGIEPHDIKHIFDRFYRADISRSAQNSAGYGLGLSIAKKIVEAHHGTISVTSEKGKGALFVVSLPLADK
jgi:signal transduction histidine kinase